MGAHRERFHRARVAIVSWLQAHVLTTFVLMGAFFLAFGAASYNLVMLLRANLELFWNYGWDVAEDGALRQFFELLVLGYFALLCYLGFKCCEKLLVDVLTKKGS